MTAAVIALTVALAGALGAITWLAYIALTARTATAEEREDHVVTRGELERVRFELKTTADKLADTEATVTALQEVLADAQTIDHGLAPGDLAGRLLRAAQLAKARIAGGPVPAGAGSEAVPDAAPARRPDAALMSLDE